jgi:hypothetical protein
VGDGREREERRGVEECKPSLSLILSFLSPFQSPLSRMPAQGERGGKKKVRMRILKWTGKARGVGGRNGGEEKEKKIEAKKGKDDREEEKKRRREEEKKRR